MPPLAPPSSSSQVRTLRLKPASRQWGVGEGTDHSLHVVGHGWIVKPKHHSFYAPESTLARANVASLHHAMLDSRRCCSALPSEPEFIHVALASEEDFHPFVSQIDSAVLRVDSDGVSACVNTTTRRHPQWPASELRRLLAGAAHEHGCLISDVIYDGHGGDPDALDDMDLSGTDLSQIREQIHSEPCDVEVRVESDGPSSVGNLLEAARSVSALLEAIKGGPLDLGSVRNLLRSGRPSLVVGLTESEWFEIKRGLYGIGAPGSSGERQKIELAQDVARFANGQCDAVIVLGLSEKGSTVDRVSPVPLGTVDIQQYRAVLDAKVVPPIRGLEVETVDLGNEAGLVMISVPRQASELQPFLVHGAVAADKLEGAFFSIVQRRGEASITTSAAQIHAYIVAGKAMLRGNVVESALAGRPSDALSSDEDGGN